MVKLRVGVLFGGRSGEHEVSLRSAASVIEAIDKTKYEVVPIGITKDGRWLAPADSQALLSGKTTAECQALAGKPNETECAVGTLLSAVGAQSGVKSTEVLPIGKDGGPLSGSSGNVDIIFPVLHGTFGEDGTVQGLFELADIAYVGAGVLGSAAGMDKDLMKRLFREAGLPIVKHETVLRLDWEHSPRKVQRRIETSLTYPVFVKPANLGSSVGISKAHEASELRKAMDEAAQYDRKIIVEQSVGGKRAKARELECSVLGNDQPEASVIGEVVPHKEFYDYTAKYLEQGSEMFIPARITKSQAKQVRGLAVRAFLVTECAGMGRVDFLMDPRSQRIYVNEINTIPGFTSISQYPKLWAASGLPFPRLIDRLIDLGLERHREKLRNQYHRS
ncbi:MAG: D-alanine--D-alanine ligase family protein [Terriglobales bacterium]|jgi:D-alanine-D-alanine ligase